MGFAPGSRRSDKTFPQVPLDNATQYAGEDADVTLPSKSKVPLAARWPSGP
jgi:hypothetical protein